VTREGRHPLAGIFYPKAGWHEFWTHEVHEGPGRHHGESPARSRCRFSCAPGAIVPMGPVGPALDRPSATT
jgi:hypothetical protein